MFDLELAKLVISMVCHYYSIYLGCVFVIIAVLVLLALIIVFSIKFKFKKRIAFLSIIIVCSLLIPVMYWFSNEFFYIRKDIKTSMLVLINSFTTKQEIEEFLQLGGALFLEKKFKVFLDDKDYYKYVNLKLGVTNNKPNEVVINTEEMDTNTVIEIMHGTDNNTIVTISSNGS